MVRWGVYGTPVLVFPTAGGDAEEIERNGLVNACGPLLAEGRIKLYSVDSVAGQAMVTKRARRSTGCGCSTSSTSSSGGRSCRPSTPTWAATPST